MYNSVLTLPFIVISCVLTGEVSSFVGAYQHAADIMGNSQTLLLLVFSSVAGMLLNFSLFLCTHANTALTTTVIGSLKGVTVTALGFVLLGGVEVHAMNAIGVALNTIGGVWYSCIRVKQMTRRHSLVVKENDSAIAYDQDVESGNDEVLPVTPSEDVRFHAQHFNRLRSIDSFLDIDAVCDEETNKRITLRVRV